MPSPDETLANLGYPLDRVPKPAAVYRPVSIAGNLAYVSGAIPLDGDKLVYVGKVPTDLSLQDAQKAAALCAANLLRMLRSEFGSLDRVSRIVRLTGYVNAQPDFTDQHLVINGASQLLLDVFGQDRGLAARSAVGAAQLPLGAAVETELIVELTSSTP